MKLFRTTRRRASHQPSASRRRLAVQLLESRRLLAGDTYYVDSVDGDDALSGDAEASAWKSLTRLEQQSLSPGDQVFFRRGSNWNDRLDVASSRSASEPIVFDAYGTGDLPVINEIDVDGSFTALQNLVVDHGKQSGDAIQVRSATGVTLRDMVVRNGTSDGIDVDKADGLLIDGLLIHYSLAGSFTVQADAHGIVATDTDGLTIRNTEIHHVSGDSFQADPDRDTDITTNVLIEDSHFWTSPLEADFSSSWLAGQRPGENAIDTKVVKDNWETVPRMKMTVRNVTAHGWQKDSDISNKAVFNIKEKVDVVFDGVTVYDNEIAFRLRGTRGKADVTIINGAIHDNETAIRAEDDLANLTVLNTTFGDGVGTTLQFAGGSGGTSSWNLKNNAFLAGKPSVASDASNLTATSSDFVETTTGDYHLAAGSALIDAGTTLAEVPVDRDETARPQGTGFDVGSYELIDTIQSTLDFNDYVVGPYGGSQDSAGGIAIADGGATLEITGNRWKKIDFAYEVTADTVLEFDF
ncbi:MAG: right-handed parallel beta-helix repeat-containing protein, partial [Rubripirellula sp.]|nr:right-handed parallel beta-helix repeat-containing protein [Rubripirellula sp.]